MQNRKRKNLNSEKKDGWRPKRRENPEWSEMQIKVQPIGEECDRSIRGAEFLDIESKIL